MPPKSNFPQKKTYKSMSEVMVVLHGLTLYCNSVVKEPWRTQNSCSGNFNLGPLTEVHLQTMNTSMFPLHPGWSQWPMFLLPPATSAHGNSLIKLQTTLEWTWSENPKLLISNLQLGQVRVLHQCYYASIHHIPSTLLQMHICNIVLTTQTIRLNRSW